MAQRAGRTTSTATAATAALPQFFIPMHSSYNQNNYEKKHQTNYYCC